MLPNQPIFCPINQPVHHPINQPPTSHINQPANHYINFTVDHLFNLLVIKLFINLSCPFPFFTRLIRGPFLGLEMNKATQELWP